MLYYFTPQHVPVDVGIYFGGGNGFVSEHTLDGTEIGPSFQQMSGERVAKVLLGRGFSMKYKLYRSFGNLDKDVRRHELVAVEYGTNLEAVTDALIHAVSDDLAGTPEYASYKTAAFAPAPVKEFRRVRRYDYEMTGIVYPPYADKNILIDYGIIEESELEK